jgi:two-component system, OmpR family, sensor histidine kinase VicK
MENDYSQFSGLQEVADLSNDGILIFNIPRKQIVYANNAAVNIVGIAANASQRQLESLAALVIPEDRAYVINKYSQVITQKSVTGVEFRLQSQQRKELFLCCDAYLLSDKETVFVNIRDLTRPKEHETYLVEFGAKKNTILDTLVHHISGALHLQQNLASDAETKLKKGDDSGMKTYFSLVNENNRSCIEMINKLMLEEHDKSPNIYVKITRTNLVELVNYIVEKLKQNYSHRKFVFAADESALYVDTDEVKLLQVVNNLTSNAVKFSSDESEIRIAITHKQNAAIISVADGGIGIPENLKPFVFERHGGAGRTGLNGEKSVGLGLSICRNLAKLLKGDIWFESQEGKGSIFYFSIPAQ